MNAVSNFFKTRLFISIFDYYSLYDGSNDRNFIDTECSPEVVMELKKQLREKDLVLTDIRLEALSSAHQLESLKDRVNKLQVRYFIYKVSLLVEFNFRLANDLRTNCRMIC